MEDFAKQDMQLKKNKNVRNRIEIYDFLYRFIQN